VDADLVSLDLEGNRIAGLGGRSGHQQRGENEEFFHVSLLVQRACRLARTLCGPTIGFRDLRHPGGTVIQITFGAVSGALVFRAHD
jgi:hypothetical protein